MKCVECGGELVRKKLEVTIPITLKQEIKLVDVCQDCHKIWKITPSIASWFVESNTGTYLF